MYLVHENGSPGLKDAYGSTPCFILLDFSTRQVALSITNTVPRVPSRATTSHYTTPFILFCIFQVMEAPTLFLSCIFTLFKHNIPLDVLPVTVRRQLANSRQKRLTRISHYLH